MMATATQIQTSTISLANGPSDDAIRLAALCRVALNTLYAELPDFNPSQAYSPDEIVNLPLSAHRLPDELYDLPRRRSARASLAQEIAALLSPSEADSLTALIRYEAERVKLRAWTALQREFDRLTATRKNGRSTHGLSGGVSPGVQAPVWSSRITAQGPWDPAVKPISLNGVSAIPMPVEVAQGEDLKPFLGHLRRNGTADVLENDQARVLEEPYYNVQALEFNKGVLYDDGRMDLCKMVVGPEHIWSLMSSLRHNTFIKHFLLGNNVIGPSGVNAIAEFLRDHPDKIETWYLAGNCIDTESFAILAEELVKSDSVTNIWLKRNPLGHGSAGHLAKLVIGAKNLRTLDLDQTELGDQGVADLFTQLAAHKPDDASPLPLRNIYLNGSGISTKATTAIGRFLASPACGLTSLYMSSNPLGDEGIQALAEALPHAPQLTRLLIQSAGVSTKGAIALCQAACGHPSLRVLDLGQAYTTEDLGQAYNYITDEAVDAIAELIRTSRLEYLNLGHAPISPAQVRTLNVVVMGSRSLLFWNAVPILPDPSRKVPTFRPSRDLTLTQDPNPPKDHLEAEKALRDHLAANVRVRYGEGVTYKDFVEEEKRWLVSDKDVRKIDSVYRNREAGMARRGIAKLVKEWGEGDDTLEKVKHAVEPVCTVRG
ncbi:uncharacterized protein J7T54_001044 [Emericellopsis cladophorae]|uniref:RNI-like protein n=1 Tax=Emericellopsis cladophorae TaxID=2686198 RepID=A0A9P9XZX9_9HYPO|nr:uncharacterized protein J7T54_001044 [Emericellopsis cladophorae]KAI6780736.1 hypothetical protein J7T54_001044 [Emericellopsis cladophorae]